MRMFIFFRQFLARTESSKSVTGVSSIISIVTLQQGGAAGTEAAALVAVGQAQVATFNWSFLLGQSLMPVLNAVLLGTLLYRSRLVPRILPTVGLIGAQLHLSAVALIAVLIAEYTVVDREDAAWDAAALTLTALTYALALVMFALLHSLGARALVSATGAGLIAAASARLLAGLVSSATPRTREQEAEKARQRNLKRFGG